MIATKFHLNFFLNYSRITGKLNERPRERDAHSRKSTRPFHFENVSIDWRGVKGGKKEGKAKQEEDGKRTVPRLSDITDSIGLVCARG